MLYCQEHSDDEMFDQSQGDGSYQSAQASSFEPGSESLLIPKTIGQTSKKELMENQTETKPDTHSTASFVPGNEFINQCSFKLTGSSCGILMKNTLRKFEIETVIYVPCACSQSIHSIAVTTVANKENEDEQVPNVVVKEELPWQIKYSADGKQILRAAPTSPDDPVEVSSS